MTTKPPSAYTRGSVKRYFNEFASDLQSAITNALPSHTQPYGQVAVLAFHWATDDMGVQPLESDLLDVFKHTYGFHVEAFAIPGANSFNSLVAKLLEFSSKWAAQDALRIYLYSGHAEAADSTSTRWYLGGSANDQGFLTGSRVDWFALRPLIETAVPQSGPNEESGDILYVFDSCSAGAAGIYDGPELFAACGWNDIAGASLVKSFTQTLINKLREFDGAPRTVAQIFAAIFREAAENEMSAMPVHLPHSKKHSITLSKLPLPQPPRPESSSRRISELATTPTPTHRVLISVEVRDRTGLPDIQEWVKYLTTNIPSGVLSADVSVHSAFEGSTVILLTLPLEVWTMLPSNIESYKFVAHVGRELAFGSELSMLASHTGLPSSTENEHPSQWPKESFDTLSHRPLR